MNCVLFFGPAKKPTLFFRWNCGGPKPAIGYIHSKHWKFQLVLISKKTHRSPKINHPNCQIEVGNHWISKGPVIENNPSNLTQLIPAMASHHLTSQRQSIALRGSDHVMGTESLCFERFNFWQPCYKIPWKPLSFGLTLRHWNDKFSRRRKSVDTIHTIHTIHGPGIFTKDLPSKSTIHVMVSKIRVPQNGWWK